jgi:membrane protein
VQLFPDRWHDAVKTVTDIGYWPFVAVLSLLLLATLYHLAVPVRTPWRRALPGALLALVLWLVGSILLRAWLSWAFRSTATYGPLSAPVAVLVLLYLTALAILIGAELNAQIDRLWPTHETEQARDMLVDE